MENANIRIKSEYLFAILGLLADGAIVLWPDKKLIGWVIISCAAIVFLFGINCQGSGFRIERPRILGENLNLYFLIMGLSALVFTGALTSYLVDRSRGPIEWTFDENSPLGHSRSSGGPLWIDDFQIKGRNRWKEPISSIQTFVRSDINNRTLQLQFSGLGSGLVPAENVIIPPETPFILIAIIPSTDQKKSQGIIVDEFRSEFGRFTLVFNYDGKKFVKHFSESEVERFISRADRVTREALKRATQPPRPVVRD